MILKIDSVEYGAHANAPVPPVRDGYTFMMWDAEYDKIESDKEVNAIYEKNYTVNWYVNGVIKHTQSDIAGTMLINIPELDELSRDCSEKRFLGWSLISIENPTDIKPECVDTKNIVMPIGGANYYAVFADKEEKEILSTYRVYL